MDAWVDSRIKTIKNDRKKHVEELLLNAARRAFLEDEHCGTMCHTSLGLQCVVCKGKTENRGYRIEHKDDCEIVKLIELGEIT